MSYVLLENTKSSDSENNRINRNNRFLCFNNNSPLNIMLHQQRN